MVTSWVTTITVILIIGQMVCVWCIKYINIYIYIGTFIWLEITKTYKRTTVLAHTAAQYIMFN